MHTAPTVLLDKEIFIQMGVKNNIREPEFQSFWKPCFLPPPPWLKPPGEVTLPCLPLHQSHSLIMSPHWSYRPRAEGVTYFLQRVDIPQRQRRDYCHFKGKPFKEGPKREAKDTFTVKLNKDSLVLQCCTSLSPRFGRQYSLCCFRGLYHWSFHIASTESARQMIWWPLDVFPSETVFPS